MTTMATSISTQLHRQYEQKKAVILSFFPLLNSVVIYRLMKWAYSTPKAVSILLLPGFAQPRQPVCEQWNVPGGSEQLPRHREKQDVH